MRVTNSMPLGYNPYRCHHKFRRNTEGIPFGLTSDMIRESPIGYGAIPSLVANTP
jgi:hypothetical protein